MRITAPPAGWTKVSESFGRWRRYMDQDKDFKYLVVRQVEGYESPHIRMSIEPILDMEPIEVDMGLNREYT